MLTNFQATDPTYSTRLCATPRGPCVEATDPAERKVLFVLSVSLVAIVAVALVARR